MFYGLDAHKAFIQVCELADVGPHRKDYPIGATSEALEAFAQRLGPTDHVVLEATFHTWAIHSILARRAGSVTVANPYAVRCIAKARVKTGKIDAHILAQLLRAGFLPSVQMPSEETSARRQLVSHRRLLVKQRTAAKNSIRAVLKPPCCRAREPDSQSILEVRTVTRHVSQPAGQPPPPSRS